MRAAPNGVDPQIALDVTLVSLRAAATAGYRFAVTLGFDPEQVDTGGLELRVSADFLQADLALAPLVRERFYIPMQAGQAFPWTVPPHVLFRAGRAAFFGQSAATEGMTRARAALLSGVPVTSAVVPASPATIYSTRLAERAATLLQSMHGQSLTEASSILTSEASLYALMNDDRMHIDHVLVERAQSPLDCLTDSPETGTSSERLYARLRGF